MNICYDETSGPAGEINVAKMDGTKQYLRHYANLVYLTFIANRSDKQQERRQAEKEMKIAERKMAFWARHPRYDQARVLAGIAEIKKEWRSK